MNGRVRPLSFVFLALSLSFQTAAVILGKIAALRLGHPTLGAFLSNPWFHGSLACLILQSVVWQLVLREVRLFVAYLVTSLTYFLVLVASRFLFLERVTILNIIGAAVIFAGVYLVLREDLA
jgi:drug/metabolite transporter (DMT)-like permease